MAENPPWLTETFLATVIQGGELATPQLTVKSFTVTPAVSKGNNYMSIAYRVRARYVEGDSEETKTVGLIIKAPITKGVINEFQEQMKILEVEPRVYDEVLPKVNELLGSQLTPKRFYCPLENTMVLGDLSTSGYVMCDKNRQLDFAHCSVLMETLGRYHAASVRLHNQGPGHLPELGRERMCVEDGPICGEMRPWLSGGVTAVAGIAAAIPGCQEIGKYLLSRIEKMPESVVDICRIKEDKFNVLNHGDLWVNNILFKHDPQGIVEDIILIDFQMVRWNSPVVDLLYFFWTSANEESRNRIPDLLSTYLQSLNDTLDKLGCDQRLSLKELEADMKASSDWAIMVIGCTLPMMMCSEEDAIAASDMKKDQFEGDELERTMKSFYGGKNYNAVLPGMLRQLQQWLLS